MNMLIDTPNVDILMPRY